MPTFCSHHLPTDHKSAKDHRGRSGSALVLVMIVIVMLTLGAYTFSELMITEYQASDAYQRQVQAKFWAESGVDYVAMLLSRDGAGIDADLFDNPGVFHVPLGNGGGFSIVAPAENATAGGTGAADSVATLRFGLIDECAKINVNVLANYDSENDTGRYMLMSLPGMTVETADAILDWIDADSTRREWGAEAESYSYVPPRNGPIDSLEELLLIPGITPQLLYGEDANRNGILDPNENDGDQSLPYDNADGVLDLGWSAYLTTYSVEANYRHAYDRFGDDRIFVNEPLLTDLYDALMNEFDEETAQFIVAYRMYGPIEPLAGLDDSDGGNPLNGVGSGSRTSTTGDRSTDEFLGRAAESVARSIFQGNGDPITRSGLDLSRGATVEIRSLYELVGAEVEAEIDGQPATLVSPWTNDPGSLQATLPLLFDALTVTNESVIRGRININQARREVLQAIPGMPLDLPDQIISARARMAGTSATLDQTSTTGWLLIQGLVDLPTMARLDGFITTRGDVYRMQVVGHADRGGPVARIEAVIDATQTIPRVIFQRSLSDLGPGFRSDQLPRFFESDPF